MFAASRAWLASATIGDAFTRIESGGGRVTFAFNESGMNTGCHNIGSSVSSG